MQDPERPRPHVRSSRRHNWLNLPNAISSLRFPLAAAFAFIEPLQATDLDPVRSIGLLLLVPDLVVWVVIPVAVMGLLALQDYARNAEGLRAEG